MERISMADTPSHGYFHSLRGFRSQLCLLSSHSSNFLFYCLSAVQLYYVGGRTWGYHCFLPKETCNQSPHSQSTFTLTSTAMPILEFFKVTPTTFQFFPLISHTSSGLLSQLPLIQLVSSLQNLVSLCSLLFFVFMHKEFFFYHISEVFWWVE